MSDVQPDFSATEQKYFDTRGAIELNEEAPATEEEIAVPGAADVAATAADEPADGDANVDDGKAQDDNPGKFVRHGAFHEERQRRKEAEANFQAYREQEAARTARLEERLNHVANQFRQPEPVVTDPNERLARLEQTFAQQKQQQEEEHKVEQVRQQFFDAVAEKEREFSKDVPDYLEAIKFAKAARLDDIMALGVDEDEAQVMLERDIIGIADDAFRRRINPAERFYKYAVHRGWGKEALAPAVKEQAPADKLKTIAAGQQAGKSLGAAPGSSQAALTLQALADMPQDEFDKIDSKTWRKMMGG